MRSDLGDRRDRGSWRNCSLRLLVKNSIQTKTGEWAIPVVSGVCSDVLAAVGTTLTVTHMSGVWNETLPAEVIIASMT